MIFSGLLQCLKAFLQIVSGGDFQFISDASCGLTIHVNEGKFCKRLGNVNMVYMSGYSSSSTSSRVTCFPKCWFLEINRMPHQVYIRHFLWQLRDLLYKQLFLTTSCQWRDTQRQESLSRIPKHEIIDISVSVANLLIPIWKEAKMKNVMEEV